MALHADTLLRVTESFARGSFEELFDYKWTNLESFITAACDYVPRKNRFKFGMAVRQAVGSLPSSSR